MTDYYSDRPAGFWIGHPGALLSLPGIKGGLSRSVERSAEYKTSASGSRRAYLSGRRAPLREWKVAIPHLRPDESSVLHGLLMDTDPPYVWVDVWSRVTNLLTPAAAGMRSSVPVLAYAGRQPLEGGGYAPTAGVNPGQGVVRVEPAPVVPELPVTVSAWLASPGSAWVTAVFRDSAGATVGAPVLGTSVTGTDLLRRSWVSVPAVPVGAAAVEVQVSNAAVIAQPAVTWTAGLMEYGGGGGAAQVVVTGFEESVERAELLAAHGRLSQVTFTVTEVG